MRSVTRISARCSWVGLVVWNIVKCHSWPSTASCGLFGLVPRVRWARNFDAELQRGYSLRQGEARYLAVLCAPSPAYRYSQHSVLSKPEGRFQIESLVSCIYFDLFSLLGYTFTFWEGRFLFSSHHSLTFKWWGCCGLCLWHKPTELAHSFLFCSCVCFCLYGPFNCISFHKFSWQFSPFSLFSSSLISAFGPFNYIYLYESLLQPSYIIILSGWLGLKQQLTD